MPQATQSRLLTSLDLMWDVLQHCTIVDSAIEILLPFLTLGRACSQLTGAL